MNQRTYSGWKELPAGGRWTSAKTAAELNCKSEACGWNAPPPPEEEEEWETNCHACGHPIPPRRTTKYVDVEHKRRLRWEDTGYHTKEGGHHTPQGGYGHHQGGHHTPEGGYRYGKEYNTREKNHVDDTPNHTTNEVNNRPPARRLSSRAPAIANNTKEQQSLVKDAERRKQEDAILQRHLRRRSREGL